MGIYVNLQQKNYTNTNNMHWFFYYFCGCGNESLPAVRSKTYSHYIDFYFIYSHWVTNLSLNYEEISYYIDADVGVGARAWRSKPDR